MKTGLDTLLARDASSLPRPFTLASTGDSAQRLTAAGHPADVVLPLGALPSAGSGHLLIDVADGGLRSHAACGWLKALLEHAASAELPVTLLDRPNPLDGTTIEGPLVRPGFQSASAPLGLPLRHGLTPGELARFFVRQQSLSVALDVVRCGPWDRREADNDDLLEVGLSLLDCAPLSLARTPHLGFRHGGVSAQRLLDLCRKGASDAGLQGATFDVAPDSADRVVVHVSHPAGVDSLMLALVVLEACTRAHPMEWRQVTATDGPRFAIDRLLGSPDVRVGLACRVRPEEIMEAWQAECAQFVDDRRAVLLY